MTRLAGQLAALEAAWAEEGAPDAETLAPGLPENAVRARLAAAGLPAPSEIVQWFCWHDGSIPYEYVRPVAPTASDLLSLDRSIEAFAAVRQSAREAAEDWMGDGDPDDEAASPDFWWEPAWLPIIETNMGHVAADLAHDPSGERVPVRVVEWDDEDFREVRSPSVAGMVERWLTALRDYWHYDIETAGWCRAPTPSEVLQADPSFAYFVRYDLAATE